MGLWDDAGKARVIVPQSQGADVGTLGRTMRFLLAMDEDRAFRDRLVESERMLGQIRRDRSELSKPALEESYGVLIARANRCDDAACPEPRYRLRKYALLGEAHRETLAVRLEGVERAHAAMQDLYDRKDSERAARRAQIAQQRNLVMQREREGNFIGARRELEKIRDMVQALREQGDLEVEFDLRRESLVRELDPVAREHQSGLARALRALRGLQGLTGDPEVLRLIVIARLEHGKESIRERVHRVRAWRPEPTGGALAAAADISDEELRATEEAARTSARRATLSPADSDVLRSIRAQRPGQGD